MIFRRRFLVLIYLILCFLTYTILVSHNNTLAEIPDITESQPTADYSLAEQISNSLYPNSNLTALQWGTYFGGSSYDAAFSIAIDSLDNIVVTGYTTSDNFPVLNSFNETHDGSYDGFVAKFNSAGNLIWSTMLGGSGFDIVRSVSVDSVNNIIVIGITESDDFPVLNGFDETYDDALGLGYPDAFVTKFNSDGSLLWSSYLGGSYHEEGRSVTIDSQDNIIVAGESSSANFPVLYGYNKTNNDFNDAFVTKFDSSGELIWSTMLGGSEADQVNSVAIDSVDNIIVNGNTYSDDFPVLNGYNETYNNFNDVFVTKFNSSGNLIWSSFLGGSSFDWGTSVVIDSHDAIIISGFTNSIDFPVLNGFDETHNNVEDSFISKFSSSGDLIWSTYFGGNSNERLWSVALDSLDNIIVTGSTESTDFPVLYGFNDTRFGFSEMILGNKCVFISVFNSSGSLFWSFFLGGSSSDIAYSVALDSQENLIVAGSSVSDDFPVLNGYNETFSGSLDSFIIKINLIADPVDDVIVTELSVNTYLLATNVIVFTILIFGRKKRY